MSGHAEIIRSYLDGFVDGRDIHDFPTFDETTAALDALLAENQRLEVEVRRLREGWDEWQAQALGLEAENQRLRDALDDTKLSLEEAAYWLAKSGVKRSVLYRIEESASCAGEALAGDGE